MFEPTAAEQQQQHPQQSCVFVFNVTGSKKKPDDLDAHLQLLLVLLQENRCKVN